MYTLYIMYVGVCVCVRLRADIGTYVVCLYVCIVIVYIRMCASMRAHARVHL